MTEYELDPALGTAAVRLAPDLAVCRALIAGKAVRRDRLDADVLASIGEPLEGPLLALTPDLALAVEANRPPDVTAEVPRSARRHDVTAGPRTSESTHVRVVSLDEFAELDEPGAEALVGAGDESALMPADGDVMIYGDGGAGKTTLAVDLGCHLAAGDSWLGIPVTRPARVLLIENEGPRPAFRMKLRRKRAGWAGSELGDRLLVLEEPWSRLTLADDLHREALAEVIRDRAVDVVIFGPVTRTGMNDAGTLQEVRDFTMLLADVRMRADRPVAFVLVHHESKSGQVSGAWEGASDTLLHVQGQGHGRTRLFVQKARWSTAHHGTTLHLSWTDGDGFAVDDAAAERGDDTIADEILAAVLASGGAGWNAIEKRVTGKGDRKRAIRDRLLEGGRLVNAGSEARMQLWHADDPARPALPDELRPVRDAPGTHPASATRDTATAATASLRPDVEGTQDAGTQSCPGTPPPEDTA